MKTLFLLSMFALIAVLAMANVSAAVYCCNSDNGNLKPSGCANGVAGWGDWQSSPCEFWECSIGACTQVPEFTTIGMGIAVAGAGLGYALIRKKRK